MHIWFSSLHTRTQEFSTQSLDPGKPPATLHLWAAYLQALPISHLRRHTGILLHNKSGVSFQILIASYQKIRTSIHTQRILFSCLFYVVYTVILTHIPTPKHNLNTHPEASLHPLQEGLCSNLLTSFRQDTGMPVQALPTASQQAIYYQDNYHWRIDSFLKPPHYLHGYTQQAPLCALSSPRHTSQITTMNLIKMHTIAHFPGSKGRDSKGRSAGRARMTGCEWCSGRWDANGHLREAIKTDQAAVAVKCSKNLSSNYATANLEKMKGSQSPVYFLSL